MLRSKWEFFRRDRSHWLREITPAQLTVDHGPFKTIDEARKFKVARVAEQEADLADE